MVDADKGSWSWSYNAIGDLIEERTARGGCIRHAYDDAGRLVRRDDLIGGRTGTLEQRTEWRYDSVGAEAGDFDARTAPGRLLRTNVASGNALTTPIERRSWRYDTLGRASHQRTALRDGTPASGTPRLYEEQSWMTRATLHEGCVPVKRAHLGHFAA